MAYCGKCLHLDVCKTADSCDGHVPRCKHFMDKAERFTAQTVVQDGKPLEAFLHPIIAYEGLKDKYLVFNAASGKKIENCFVLRPDRDTAAVDALRTYANSTDNKTLGEDIYNWIGKGEPVQEWIPVSDRLPERTLPPKDVLVYHDLGCGMFVDRAWYSYDKGRWCSVLGMKLKVTHWMPLPQPPKEGTP